jgi:hypothetical protein
VGLKETGKCEVLFFWPYIFVAIWISEEEIENKWNRNIAVIATRIKSQT